ncbi:hypothetical protein [Pelagicoccus sp. SDUM812003]|uniref:hypothetical protein n=1 Tax=Pelagicoccus sp. SDUM812003 TaxID=3041267 RepID=UPI00280FF7E3|nr:hypothetical protein [Pelagicoccus sp. SDUM812003]MDQ8202724.1 hypothetical protein [Pelagicoccus sp. SDUM812003]
MKRALKLIAVTGLLAGAAHAADITVDAPISENTVWTNDNEYTLSGFIFVQEGASLTIEPGTVIRAEAGTGASASALVVQRGAKIYAVGTPSEPIIFTAAADPMDGTWTPDQGGAWGGVVILGAAPINSNASGTGTAPGLEDAIEGIPAAFGDARLYGGEDAEDNSGIFRYVSIRFGGSLLAPDNELNGLTLGGVGSGTLIEFVEVFANADDGVEFFGGTVNTRFMAVAYQGDDGFDYDQGYNGKAQFWFNIADARINSANDSFEPDNGAEMDGEVNSQGGNIGGATIYNATFVGPGDGAGRALRTRDNAFSKYFNSIFTGWTDEAVRIDADSAERIAPDDDATMIELANNIFDATSFAGTTAADLSHGDEGEGDDEEYLFDPSFNNSVVDPMLRGLSRGTFTLVNEANPDGPGFVSGDGMLDPRPSADSPAFSNARKALPADDPWYLSVDHIGAFGSTNWLYGWSYLDSAGYLPQIDNAYPIAAPTSVSSLAQTNVNGFANIALVVEGDLPRLFIIRARGPKILDDSNFEAADLLADPEILIRDFTTGEVVATETGWTDRADVIDMMGARVGMSTLAPEDGRPTDDTTSAALLISLNPGVYTIRASGEDDGAGIVQIAAWMLDR